MLTQDEIQRAMYEDREKARRDAASWRSALEHWKQEAALSRTEGRAEGRTEGRAQGELIGQIQAFQYVLGRQQTSEEELTAMSLDQLRSLIDELRSQLNGEENNQ